MEWYMGSADLMERNLDRRVEAVVPVEDSEAGARIEAIIVAMLADERHSWQLGPDSRWQRTEELVPGSGESDVFETLKRAAIASATRRDLSGEALFDGTEATAGRRRRRTRKPRAIRRGSR
jgi:polyphosphate kinase